MHRPNKLFCGEQAPLIRIDGLRQAGAAKCLMSNLDRLARLQGYGIFGRQYLPAGPVNHCCERDETFGHGNVRGVQSPDLVGPVNGHPMTK